MPSVTPRFSVMGTFRPSYARAVSLGNHASWIASDPAAARAGTAAKVIVVGQHMP